MSVYQLSLFKGDTEALLIGMDFLKFFKHTQQKEDTQHFFHTISVPTC